MAFSLSGSVITQSGVDADLSGLSGIAGVTVTPLSPYKNLYTLDDSISDFKIDGELTTDSEIEILVMQTNESDCVTVNGTWRVGRRTIVGGQVRYSKGLAVSLTRVGESQFSIGAINVNGRFEWRGGDIETPTPNGVRRDGTAEIFSGRYICTNATQNAMVMRNDGAPENVIIHSLILDSRDVSTGVPVIFSRDGISQQSYDIRAGFFQMRNGSTAGVATLRNYSVANNAFDYDYEFNGARSDYSLLQGGVTINSDVGTGLRVAQATWNSAERGHVAMYQEIQVSALDLDGNNIDGMKVYIPTIDSGNRVNAGNSTIVNWQDNVDFTAGQFDVYEEVTESGITPIISILLGRIWFDSDTPPTPDASGFARDFYHKGQSDGDDNFDIFCASYNHALNGREEVLKQLGVQRVDFIMLPDNLITEPNKALVDAYTKINDAFMLYDMFKANLIDNYAGENEILVMRNGSAIDLGHLDLVIDPTIDSAFIFDGSTITIKSDSYSGLIRTTGTVSLVNGAVQSGGIIDANGILVSVRSDAMFNIIARHSAMAAGVYYPYQENVDNAAFTVPAGETLEIAMWQLGKQVLYERIDPASTPSFFAPFIDHPFVNATIDVTTILENIDVALSPTQYSVTFNAPVDINIEQVKTVLHHIFGQAPSLIASLAAGEGPRAIVIGADDITINSPIIKALRGSELTTSQDVVLRAFFNDANALSFDPNYTLTPQDANNIRVQTLIEKPALDPSQLSIAVWENSNGVATLGHARAANIQTQE